MTAQITDTVQIMKVTIERSALLKSLSHVQSVVEKRNTIPILSNVLIDATGPVLTLSATDLDIAVVEETPATIQTAGATTVAAHTLFDIVRKLPDGSSVDLELMDNDRLEVKAGRSEFKLSALDRQDFPVMSTGTMPYRFQLAAPELVRLIDKARFAISTEETRYYLNGIYLHVAEGGETAQLRAVATDGHRLAQVEQDVPEGAEGMPGIIVPRKTVAEIRKLIDEIDGGVDVSLSDTKIQFEFAGTIVTSKLIDGNFPDYSRVIPQDNDKTLELDCRVFAEAVDRVSTISSDKTRSVKLGLADDMLTLSVNSPDSGSATEQLSAHYGEDAMEIGFNSRYLLDILAQVEGETVELQLADPAAPTVVRDSVDAGSLYVLMPMRV